MSWPTPKIVWQPHRPELAPAQAEELRAALEADAQRARDETLRYFQARAAALRFPALAHCDVVIDLGEAWL